MNYKQCTLCPRKCGVNREIGELGFCKMPSNLNLARAALHLWEEPCISGTKGSGTIFFSGCSMNCVYCQNSDIARGTIKKEVSNSRLEEIFWELKKQGAHNINLVTPTHYVPTIKEAIIHARQNGFDLPFVYNTSGYETKETLKELDGLIQIYLTDHRYAESSTAQEYSFSKDYPTVVGEALGEMVRQTQNPIIKDGLMLSGTIIRILLLPGHVLEAKKILLQDYKKFGNKVYFSLMQQYTPNPHLKVPLNRRVSVSEYHSLVSFAESLGIEQAFVQERESAQESFIPKFDYTGV